MPAAAHWRAQVMALLRLDIEALGNTRSPRERASLAVSLAVVAGLGLWASPQVVPLIALSDASMQGAIDLGSFGLSALLLASFGGRGLQTRAGPLLKALPVEHRTPWALFVARGAVLALAWAFLCGVPLARAALFGYPGLHAQTFAFIGAAPIAAVLVGYLGGFLALITAGAPRLWRWSAWGLLVAFAVAPVAGFAVTRDFAASAPLAGPSYPIARALLLASSSGGAGLLLSAGALVVLALALAIAPIPARAVSPESSRLREGPWLPFPEEALPSRFATPYRPPFDRDWGTGTSMYATMEAYRAIALADGAVADVAPLEFPEGALPTLRALTRQETDWRAWALGLGSLLAIIILFAWVLWIVPPSRGTGAGLAAFPFAAAVGTYLFLLASVAAVVSPAFRPALLKRGESVQRKREEESPPRASWWRHPARPRPMPGAIRTWPMLQTMPVTRGGLQEVFMPRPAALVAWACAALVFAGALYLWLRPGPDVLLLLSVEILVCLAALSGLGVVLLADSAVPRGYSSRRWLLRRASETLWVVAGFSLLFPAVLIPFQALVLGTAVDAATVGLMAAVAAVGAAQPVLWWRAFEERLVTAERPHESTKRLGALAASAAGVTALALGLVVVW